MSDIENKLLKSIVHLTQRGISLSEEKDINKLLDRILSSAKELTNAEAGTLYLTSLDEQKLNFTILRNDKLKIYLDETKGGIFHLFQPIPLYTEDGDKNLNNVSTAVANLGVTINISDAYYCNSYDFSGTLKFDQTTGYRSKSFLTVPMKNHEGDIIGVLQLINALDDEDQSIVRAFTQVEQNLVESLASMAATALTQRRLIESQRNLFDSVVKLIANAIDAKSPYTSGHCQRVPVVAQMLAQAVNRSNKFAFNFNDDELYELEIAAWLHDCGKLATPDYIIDKRTKLDGLNDCITEVETRLSSLHQEQRANYWEQLARSLCSDDTVIAQVESKIQESHNQLSEHVNFLRMVNQGDEFMAPALQIKVQELSSLTWKSLAGTQSLLTQNEVSLLNISRGTLSDTERKITNDHIVVTIDMLKNLPYPKKLSKVLEIAGSHHERIDGKGYPSGLTKEHLSIRARILAIADIFEALTAKDRPYKKPKSLSETIKIMGFMAKEGHIDPDLFQLFLDQKVYLEYATVYLNSEQIDMD